MTKRSSDPIPVVDLPREHELASLAVLVQSAMQEPPAGLPRVKWRIRSTLGRQAEWRRRALRVALVGALVFLAGGVVGAVVQPVFSSRIPWNAPSSAERSRSSSHPRRARSRLPPPPAAHESSTTTSETPTASSATPIAAEAAATPAALVGLAEAPAMAGALPHPIARPPATPSVRARAPLALPALSPPRATSEAPVVRQAAVSATASVLTPPAPPAEPLVQPVQPEAPSGARRMALLAPPALPANAAGEIVLPPAPAPIGPAPPRKPSEVAAPGAGAPADEQALLARALQRLRVARDPSGALALLDQHAARFPAGALAPEAARLRTEALLLTGRKDVVLAELDRQSALPDGDERRVLRGELRATAGRWRAALADFDVVVRSLSSGAAADGKAREHLERALWGRASARSHLADQAGARADLLAYLARFPSGRFAALATRLLGERR